MKNTQAVSEILLPSTDQIKDRHEEEKVEEIEGKNGNGRRKLMGVVFTTILVLGFICGLYFGIGLREEVGSRGNDSGKDQNSIILTKEKSHFIVDLDTVLSPEPYPHITSLHLQDPTLTSFNTFLFPNLNSLTISPSLKLSQLIINNTQLTEFVYSSPDLQLLKLINNSKLTSFHNSSLPSLIKLEVSNTPITSFTNNILIHLQTASFKDSQIKTLPLRGVGITFLLLDNCGDIDTKGSGFYQYFELESLMLEDTNFVGDVEFRDMGELRQIVVRNVSFGGEVTVRNCSKFQQLNFYSQQHIFSLYLENLPVFTKCDISVPNISTVYLYNTNLSYFTINTTNISKLIITGEGITRIQDYIPNLKSLIIQHSLSWTQKEFSRIKTPFVTEIIVVNCTNLKSLNNSFQSLLDLQMILQKNTSLQELYAPALVKLSIVNSVGSDLDTRNFRALLVVKIETSEYERIIIQSPVSIFQLQSSRNLTALYLNTTTLTSLYLTQLPSLTLNYYRFPRLSELTISQIPSVTITNSVFSNITQLGLHLISGSLLFFNNTIDFIQNDTSAKFALSYSNVSSLNQYLEGAYNVDLKENQLHDLENVVKYAGEGRIVDLSNNAFKKVEGITWINVTKLTMKQQLDLVEFTGNMFGNVTDLTLEGSKKLKVWRNNTMERLESLNLWGCYELGENEVLEEFEGLKERGTDLKELRIDVSKYSGQFEANVKKIFPNVKIN